MILVPLDTAAAHLRLDNADPMLDLYLQAASQSVLNYIQGPGIDGFTDSFGDVIEDSTGLVDGVPFPIQAATLLVCGDLYANRESKNTDSVPEQWGYGYLCRAAVALLYPYRSPSIA